jgi:hypothetical protein
MNTGPQTGASSCSTTCVTNIFNDPAKATVVLQASATFPRPCDAALFLSNQNWMVSQFNLAETAICAQLANSNPTELLCEVVDGSTVVHTYIGEGEFPFVPQGCERTNLEFTIILNDLLVVNDLGELGSFSCETLTTAYADNGCVPGDDTLPVCAALNGLDSPCLP